MLWAGGPTGTPADDAAASALAGHVEDEIQLLNRLLALGDGNPRPGLAQWLERVVHRDRMERQIFGNYAKKALAGFDDLRGRVRLKDYIAVEERLLSDALMRKIGADFTSYLTSKRPRFAFANEVEISGARGSARIAAIAEGDTQLVTLSLRSERDEWLVEDVRLPSSRASQRYAAEYHTTLESNYSPTVLRAQFAGTEYVTLEDFSSTPPGELPIGWGWRGKDNEKPKPYEVRAYGDFHYLAARDSTHSVILGKPLHWNPFDYPVMTWCWRVAALPPAGDERFKETNDSAAGVYVLFSQNWLGVPKQVKYVWSTTLPTGTIGRRKQWLRPYFQVVESGAAQVGRWTFAKVDLLDSFRRTFGGEPKDRTVGIAVLTDGNSTRSVAEAAYADIRVWHRDAAEKGRVPDYCGRFSGAY